jgi:hypothetical protein
LLKVVDQIPLPYEICRINADGTTTYHWDRIEAAAQRWEPGCADIAVCLAKLLLPLRRQHALNGELLEALKSTHALLQAALIFSDAEARAIARQQLDVNRAAIAKAEGKKI